MVAVCVCVCVCVCVYISPPLSTHARRHRHRHRHTARGREYTCMSVHLHVCADTGRTHMHTHASTAGEREHAHAPKRPKMRKPLRTRSTNDTMAMGRKMGSPIVHATICSRPGPRDSERGAEKHRTYLRVNVGTAGEREGHACAPPRRVLGQRPLHERAGAVWQRPVGAAGRPGREW